MPYKEFANGNPLPASDIDTYLMDQAVMTFANSTARSTAIPSPKEGMLTYLEDTNAYEGWTGSAWVNINDNSGAIPLSTVTTAGDLIVGTGSGAVTRLGIGANGSIPRVASGALGYLPVGTNGQVLTVSGGAPTWATPSAPTGVTTDWVKLVDGQSIATGAATSDNGFTSGYDKYAIFFAELSSTSSATWYYSLRDNSASDTSSEVYAAQEWQGATGYFRSTYSTNNFEINIAYGTSGVQNLHGAMLITGASKAGRAINEYNFAVRNNTSGNFGQRGQSVHTIDPTRKLASVKFRVDNGTIDGGFYWVYGA